MSSQNQNKQSLVDFTDHCTAGFWGVWRYMIRDRLSVFGVFIFIALFSGASVLLPHLVQHISSAIAQGNLAQLFWLSMEVLCFFVVRGLLNFFQNGLVARVALNAVKQIRVDVFRSILSLDLTFYSSARLGDLSYRLTSDTDALASMIERCFQQAIPAVATALVLLAYLFYLNWLLTTIVTVAAPCLAWAVSFLGKKILTYSKQAQQAIAYLSSYLAEFISGIKVVKTFSKEAFELNRFTKASEDYRHKQVQIQLIMAMQYPLLGLLQGVCLLVIITFSGYCIHQKILTIPQFLGFVTALALFIDPLQKIAQNYSAIKQWQASIRRVFSLFDIPSRITSKEQKRPAPALQNGALHFEGVDFFYKKDNLILNNLFLDFPDKTMTGIVGLSGAGKSTLLNLMMRFYDPVSGVVRLGDTDLKSLPVPKLREQFGVVLQETHLFSGTIAQNIAYGVDSIDFDRVQEVAQFANAHEFIVALPNGYQTHVSERGMNLSGGQKQRLAIARALYKRPKILIFDEATSNIDAHSEALIQESIESLRGQFTLIVVAHRLTTVRNSDNIVVLEAGQVIEQGTHEQLLAQNGRYQLLCQGQHQLT